MNENNLFTGEIKVASKIVDYLSSGLYESPAACLKELINNSYDADAKLVKIFVKPDANRIIIEDDGDGMNREEFEQHFKLIARSIKRDESDTTAHGREKIGKIGIGFIAANEICDLMEIHSTKRGSKELMKVEIDFRKMRERPDQKQREGTEIAKGDYSGKVLTTNESEHYTRVFLKIIKGDAKHILSSAKRDFSSDNISLYGLSQKSIENKLSSKGFDTWDKLDPYSSTLLQVGLSIPVEYHDNWIPFKFKKKIEIFEKRMKGLKFNVKYDGSDLRQPIILGKNTSKNTVKIFQYKGKNVSAEGYFYAQHGAIKPHELNGILIRIRNASLGSYDKSFMDFPTTIGTLFQRWISAEIWVNDQLEDALNIDRKTLRNTHPAYVELQREIHTRLSDFLKDIRAQIYEKGNINRKKEKVDVEYFKLKTTIKNYTKDKRDDKVKNIILSEWNKLKSNDPDGFSEIFLKKYSVVDIYDIVLNSAKTVLSEKQFRSLVKNITDYLKNSEKE